jgi:hypothetical protein
MKSQSMLAQQEQFEDSLQRKSGRLSLENKAGRHKLGGFKTLEIIPHSSGDLMFETQVSAELVSSGALRENLL